MKIAIDLNDVVRDFSTNFLKYFVSVLAGINNIISFPFWCSSIDLSINSFILL